MSSIVNGFTQVQKEEYKKYRNYIEKLNRVREGWKIKIDLINDRKKLMIIMITI